MQITKVSGRLLFVLSCVLASAGCFGKVIRPEPPNIPVVDPPAPPPSTIQTPVEIPIEALRSVAEGAVPGRLEATPYLHLIDGGPDVPHCGLGVGYVVERAPFTMTGNGNVLNTSMFVLYGMRGRKRVPCPPSGALVYGSCGTNGETPRRLVTGFQTTLGINPDWSARIQTARQPVQPLDECDVTFFKIDITDKIVGFFGTRLQEMVDKLNERASQEVRLSERAASAWATIQQPILVAPLNQAVAAAKREQSTTQSGVWLVLGPESAGYAPVQVGGGRITTGIQVTAKPRLVIGSKPAPTDKPLPAAQQVTPGNAFFISLPIDIGYAPLNKALSDALNLDSDGISFPPTGHFSYLQGLILPYRRS